MRRERVAYDRDASRRAIGDPERRFETPRDAAGFLPHAMSLAVKKSTTFGQASARFFAFARPWPSSS